MAPQHLMTWTFFSLSYLSSPSLRHYCIASAFSTPRGTSFFVRNIRSLRASSLHIRTLKHASSSCSSRYFPVLRPYAQMSRIGTYRSRAHLFSKTQSEFTPTSQDLQLDSSQPTPQEKRMHEDARSILAAGISAVDPRIAIQSRLSVINDGASIALSVNDPSTGNNHVYSQNDFDRVLIVSFGKASAPMTLTVCEIAKRALPDLSMSGIVIVKDDHATNGKFVNVVHLTIPGANQQAILFTDTNFSTIIQQMRYEILPKTIMSLSGMPAILYQMNAAHKLPPTSCLWSRKRRNVLSSSAVYPVEGRHCFAAHVRR